ARLCSATFISYNPRGWWERSRPSRVAVLLSDRSPQGKVMSQPGKHFHEGPKPHRKKARLADQTQLDFELTFFEGILGRHADYVDVLRILGALLTLKGRPNEGLRIERRLVRLRPDDALAHYNLACSYALLKRPDQSLKNLRRAVELGYRDFRY